MTKLIKRYKQGNKSPDHDPNNPYHYHNAEGEKIVITPEDWEANVGKPYFKEIEDAVRAEQATYPSPEYEVNPDFVRNLRSTYRSNMGNGYQNYRNFSSSLPQGYTFSSEGMIVDPQGNYYVQSGYRQSPRFTYSTDNPLQFTINKGKPIERNLTFYPVNMDKRVKASLPVDRVMDVSNEREKAIEKYITDNSDSEPIYYFDIFRNPSSILEEVRDKALGYDFVVTHGGSEIYSEMARRGLISDYKEIPHPNFKNSPNFLVGVSKNEIEKYHLQENIKNAKEQQAHTNDETIIPIYRGETTYLESTKKTKPSRQEAEKKAIISIGPLEKVNTFATGGKLKLIPKSQRGIQLPMVQQTVADNTRYVRPYTSIEIAKSKKAYEQEQLQKQIEAAQERQPQLKADTRSTEQRQRDHNRAIQQEVKQKANEQAANFGRALGANHDMTVDEVNQNTLNTANLMGYMAAPYLMTTLESGYYLGTGRPKEAALTAGVGYGLPIIFRGMQQLPNTARSYVASRELNRGIKQATKQGDIRVQESYFNNPDKWYRVTETPEIHGIEQSGRNVTTSDIQPGTIQADNFRRTVGKNGLIAGTGENEGYWILNPNPERFNIFKFGQAHGNTSQAAKGQMWQGTFARSGRFPEVVLEGQGNRPTFRGMTPTGGDSRTNFVLQNWEDIPQGARLGFHTGEMPLDNLRWFQRNPDGTFTFKGSLLPNNTMYQATIYKGGPIRSERSFFTTDSQYAQQFGPVKSYTFEGRTSQAGEPLMGNRDIASEDFFVYNNTRGAENADAILGHDLITEDKPYHSQGMELLVFNLPKVRPNPKVPTLNEVATLKNDYNTFAQRHHYKHYHGLEDSESIRRASQTSESTEEELKSVFSDIRKQEELNAVAGGSTNSDGNLYFKQGIDYTVRPLLKETQEVIDQQIAPRLFGQRQSLMKQPVNDGYYRGSIDQVKKKTRVSEWNPEMISEYNRLNNESSGGWSLPDKPYIVVGKSDLRPTAQTEVHEARHQIQKSIKPTLEESKILKQAYSDVPKPSNPDGSVKPGYENYDMSVEYETMNTEARKVLLDKAGYKYDPNLSSEQNLEIQNKLLDNYSEKDIASILIDNRTGYWNNYIRQLTKNYDGPLESWVKTDEGKKKIHDWIKAMKYVGVSAGIIGTVKHSKGGKLIARQ